MTDIIKAIKTQPFGPVLQAEVIAEIKQLRKSEDSLIDDVIKYAAIAGEMRLALMQIRSYIDCPEHYNKHIDSIIDKAVGPEVPLEFK